MRSESLTTHEKLRREAAALFARRGYGGASMSEIAARVGIRKASLYNYYPSKADLMIALLEESLSSWEEACSAAVLDRRGAEARLAGYVASAVQFSRANPQAMGIIRLAAAQIPRDLRSRVQSLIDRHENAWRETMAGIFEEGVESGEVAPADPHELRLFWQVFIDGILVNQVFATTKADAFAENLQALWRFFWRAVSGREATTEITV